MVVCISSKPGKLQFQDPGIEISKINCLWHESTTFDFCG